MRWYISYKNCIYLIRIADYIIYPFYFIPKKRKLIKLYIILILDIGDVKLLKGSTVIVNFIELHRHPELYDNPLEFRPERLDTVSANSAKNAFSWLAFSAGPRNCIGMNKLYLFYDLLHNR